MVTIADINDLESLLEWAEGQPEEVSAWVLWRTYMRVLPFFWRRFVSSDFKRPEKPNTFRFYGLTRPFLISEFARTASFPDTTVSDTTVAAANGAIAGLVLVNANNVSNAKGDDVFERDDADSDAMMEVAPDAIMEVIRQDCTLVQDASKDNIANLHLDRLPLWPDQQNPMQQDLDETIKFLRDDSYLPSAEDPGGDHIMDWTFWIKWYDSVLAGEPLDRDMLREIAEIEEGEWKKGEAWISFLIGEIEQKYALKATPYPEVLSYDTEYRSRPVSSLRAATLQDARDRIADVASSMRAGGNQYAALEGEADLLETCLRKYPDRAIRLFEVCHKVTDHVAAHVANGVLPENDNLIGDVLGDLQNSADDIYNFDADVRQTVDARAKLRFGALDQGQRQQVEQFAEAVAQNAEAGLAAEFREDAAEVMNAADPEGESKPARYRLGSRLVRVLALGGAGLATVLAALATVEPAIGGAQYLWAIAKFLIGF